MGAGMGGMGGPVRTNPPAMGRPGGYGAAPMAGMPAAPAAGAAGGFDPNAMAMMYQSMMMSECFPGRTR